MLANKDANVVKNELITEFAILNFIVTVPLQLCNDLDFCYYAKLVRLKNLR